MKKKFGTEPKIGYCPLSMRLGAGVQAWAGVGTGGRAGRWAQGAGRWALSAGARGWRAEGRARRAAWACLGMPVRAGWACWLVSWASFGAQCTWLSSDSVFFFWTRFDSVFFPSH